jgi:RimJ/RimL family protein N-acetyltransferase
MIVSSLEIKRLDNHHSKDLADLLQSSTQQYSQYFIPFPFDLEAISGILSKAIKDQIYGIYVEDNLAGFYMLRGFDEGYSVPSYGVWISEKYSNKGLSTFTLQHAISFCKLNTIKKIMLKVHPDNIAAKHIYEKYGFKQTGIDPKIHHLIYHKDL